MRSICLGFFTMFFLCCPSVYAGLTYEGSSTISELMLPEVAKVLKEKTGVAFDAIGRQGSGKGFEAVMAGKVNIGGMSRSLKADEKKLSPYYMVIAFDAVAVFVHANNPIQSLTKSQIKDIFSGSITNWKQVGGQDQMIEVVTEFKEGSRATIKEFQDLALEGGAFGPGKEIDKPLDCVRYVQDHPNAITFGTISFKNPGVKAIGIDGIDASSISIKSGAYPFSRPLLLVMPDTPKGDLKTFMDFILSTEGQAIVGKFFAPIL